MRVRAAPAGTGRPGRRRGRVVAGVVFAVTPWVTLGLGTPVAFLIAAVVFSRLHRARAGVLWISAALYTAVLIAGLDALGSSPHPGAIYAASALITIVGGGLQALFTLRVPAIPGPRPARRSCRQRRDRPRPARRPGPRLAAISATPVRRSDSGHDRAASAARAARRRPGGDASRRAVTVVAVAVAVAAVALSIYIIPLTMAVMAIGVGATEMDQSIRAAGGQGMRTATGKGLARGPGTLPAAAGVSG